MDECAVRISDPDKVEATRARLLDHDAAESVAQLFRLLGDRTRVRLLYALLEAGELCVCDLAAVVEASETSVSHALRLLRGTGVVRVRRSGRMAYYSLDDAHVRLLLDVSAAHRLDHADQA